MADFLLIGLAGPAGVGKTTAALLLGAELGFPVVGFADPIREAVFALFWKWDEWHLSTGKDIPCPTYGISPRLALRAVGDHARGLQHDVYVQDMRRRVARFRGQGAVGAVIHDVRLPCEAAMVRELGVLVHVRRDGVRYSADHLTEDGVDVRAQDLKVRNPGTLDAYRGVLLSTLVDVRRRSAA